MDEYKWAELGGVTLHGFAAGAGPFTGLMVSNIPGWRGLSGARGDGDPIPGANGVYETIRTLREGKSFALIGAAIADTEAEASALLATLEGAVGGAPVMMRVHDATGAWWRRVEILNLTPADRWAERRIPFVIDLFAMDPVRYRDPVTLGPVGLPSKDGGLELPEEFPWFFGGGQSKPQIVVENTGTVPLYPVIRVTGGFGGVTVRDMTGGRSLELPMAFAEGSEVVFDSRNSRALRNGREVTIAMTRRQWPVIPKGATHVFDFRVTAPSGSPQMFIDIEIGAY